MQDTGMATLWFDDDIQELQHATAAFLTEQHANGDFVANSDDIADLQKATEAFLADRSDGECFYLNFSGQGLLLPGEQFLLPVSAAVDRARAMPSTAKNIADLVDEYLHAQMSNEDHPHTPLLDAALKTEFEPQIYKSFDEGVEPSFLSEAPLLHNQPIASVDLQRTYAAPVGVRSLPEDVDRLLGICNDDADSDSSSDDGEANSATALYAGLFFDPPTNSYIRYASLEGLLEMDTQSEELLSMQQGLIDEDRDGKGENLMSQDAYINASGHFDDDTELGGDFTTPEIDHDPLKIDTDLSTIMEEDEPASAASAASDCSMDFANRHGFVKPLVVRQDDFLDDEDTCCAEVTLKDCSGQAQEIFNESFAAKIWICELNLDLVAPTDVVDDVELELLDALAAVFEVIRSHFWTGLLTSGSDYKRKVDQLVRGFQDLVSPDRYEKFVDLAVGHLMVADECDAPTLENQTLLRG